MDPHAMAVAGGGVGRDRGQVKASLWACALELSVPGSPTGICHTETCLDFIPCTLSGSRDAWGMSWHDSGLRGFAALLEASVI